MTTFLLVHGGCHGGWSWQRVARRLRAEGHEVLVPTMTGSGDRAHLLGPDVSLATHVEDLVAVIDCEEATDVVLVAHSYGGMPATGLLDRRGPCIREAVYLDAMVGRDGATVFDGLDPAIVEEKIAGSRTVNGARVLPPLSSAEYGVFEPDDVAWVERRVTPQPALTYTEPLLLEHPTGNGVPCRYVRCMEPRLPTFDRHEQLARDLGWLVSSLATGHDAPVTDPAGVVGMLIGP